MRQKTTTVALLAWLAFGLAGTAGAADRTLTATGTVAKVDARSHTVVVTAADGAETAFVWNADTKIAGTLAPGARVVVRYAPGESGRNLALQITVSRN